MNKKILSNYADVMVNFALGFGKGIKKDDVVLLNFDTPALPLAQEVYKQIVQKGGNVIVQMIDQSFTKIFFDEANEKQLEFFPEVYQKGLVEQIDHRLYLIAEEDPLLLKKIPADKLMKNQKSKLKLRKWLSEKEDNGELTWSLCLYPTDKQSQEAGLTNKQFWNQIIKACFLEENDPVAKWKQIQKDMDKVMNKLNVLNIEKLHIVSEGTDLWITMGENRKWIGGRGANIPSFEIFTSPDWRGTEGHIFFDQPLYRYGNLIKDIRLEFKNGKVIKSSATKNEKLLKEMIAQENADKIGEYSLTDTRFSKIDKFTANTLYDENYGGKYGNTHLALGMSYHDTYSGDVKNMSDGDWEKLGFNFSIIHTDIIATKNRTVTATLKGGKEKVIYKDGKFTL